MRAVNLLKRKNFDVISDDQKTFIFEDDEK